MAEAELGVLEMLLKARMTMQRLSLNGAAFGSFS